MAYVEPFDPDSPTDADLVSEGDDMFRSVKAAILERMNTLVEDFNADPLTLLGGITEQLGSKFEVGLSDNRPASPSEELLAYYATDTKVLSLSNGAVTWHTYDLSLIGSGGGGTGTPTTLPKIGFSLMDSVKLSIAISDTVSSTTSKEGVGSGLFSLGTGSEASHILLGWRTRFKLAAESTWPTSYIVSNGNTTDGLKHATDDIYLTIETITLHDGPVGAGLLNFRYHMTNLEATSRSFDIQFDAYLLRVANQ